MLFTTCNALREYAENDPAGRDLHPFVNLVDEHGPDAILQAVDRLVPETASQVTASTAHKAKAREWARARVDQQTP
ncbi:hypothetical protein AB0E67_34730 [Streptomyces sp. NPDC032161]|uniref:hypothetical protein n=1 Tax=unclassified Streptomyces TaxID=2593676 RepID=UPI0033ED1386